MPLFDTLDKTSHIDCHLDKTSHGVFVTPDKASHAIFATLDKTSHAISADPDKTSHFLGYFLVQTAWTNHPSFLVSLDRVDVTIIFFMKYI